MSERWGGAYIYRVRPVGVDINDPTHVIYGKWNLNKTGVISGIPSNNKKIIPTSITHELKFNWKYTVTFAEQGKRKGVISYLDGTMRSRQKVTKLSSKNNVIVGETIYDYHGRPVINVLPTPVVSKSCPTDKEAVIKFYPKFNQNEAGQSYTKEDLIITSSDSSCAISTSPMGTSSGASLYYSPNNPNQNLQQAYVPDANGYPFAQTRYTPDNTGRIKEKGGVGPKFQLGNGHTTKYIYSTPSQLELNRMFGDEVGYADHYTKRVVTDPNGQVSVTYKNLSGKVIATSLAGANPPNMDSIPGGHKIWIENNYLDNGQNQIYDQLNHTITFSKSFSVAAPTEAKIGYNLITIPMVDSCNNDICVGCVYDLNLSLKDNCGNNLLPDSLQNVVVGSFQQDSLGNYVFLPKSECKDSTVYNTSINVYLEKGKYTIYKKLSLNQDLINTYLDSIDSSSCVLPYSYFENLEMQLVDSSVCQINCSTCLKKLGSLQDFVSEGGTAEEYRQRVKECEDLCVKKVDKCKASFRNLENDMTPGGQYAEYINPSTGEIDYSLPLSILNPGNKLPKSNAFWRNPVLKTDNGTSYKYVNEDGTRSRIYLSINQNTNPQTYTPQPINNAVVKYDSSKDLYYIYPNELKNVSDFIDYFKHSWAKSLVVYHPEYCYYESCKLYHNKHADTDAFSSSSFDDLLTSAKTFSKAKVFGFVKSGGQVSNWFKPKNNNPSEIEKPWDPFVFYSNDYKTQNCDDLGQELKDKFYHYIFKNGQWYTMPQIAAYTVKCGSYFPADPSDSCFSFGQPYTNNHYTDSIIHNKEWNMLKGFYLSEKQKLQEKLANCRALYGCHKYNGCIGNKDFNPFSEMQPIQNPYYSPFYDTNQPCSINSYKLYKNKIKRFPNYNDLKDMNANNTAYQMYLNTGQCPTSFNLETLLKKLVEDTALTLPHFNLNSIASLSGLFLAANNFQNPGPIPPLDYQATLSTDPNHNILTANWVNTNNSQIFATLTLTKPDTVNWSDIKSILNLVATGEHSFTAQGTVIDNNSVSFTDLTGTLDYFNLNNCTFEQVCEPNQLAKDLQQMFNVLSADTMLGTASPINLETYYSSSAGDNINLSSIYIENSAMVYSNLTLKSVGSGEFKIYNPNGNPNNGLYIVLNLNSNLSTGVHFSQITPTGDCSFEVVASNYTYPNLAITVSGKIFRIHNGDTTCIDAGNCHLPTPLNCKGSKYEVYKDFVPLIKNVLLNYDGNSNINLYSNQYVTPAIVNALPYGDSTTTSTDLGDTLIITSESGCKIKMHIGTSSNLSFSDLSHISNFHLSGTSNPPNGYKHFKFIGTFGVALGVTDTVYGSACFYMKTCKTCPDTSVTTTVNFLSSISQTIPTQLKNTNKISFTKTNNLIQYLSNDTANVFVNTLANMNSSNMSSSNMSSSDMSSSTNKCITDFYEYLQSNYDYDFIVKLTNLATTGQSSSSVFNQKIIAYIIYQAYNSCPKTFCLLIHEMINKEILFETPQEFINFFDFPRVCTPCDSAYQTYLADVKQYNGNTNTYTITPMDETLFTAYNYCNCVAEYGDYLDNIITSQMQFNTQSEFDLYVSLNNVCNDDTMNIKQAPCGKAYKEYVHCTARYNKSVIIVTPAGTLDTVGYFLDYIPKNIFDSLGLCSCVDYYCTALQNIETGLKSFQSKDDFLNYVYGQLDCERKPSCSPSPSQIPLTLLPKDTNVVNPCIQSQITQAKINARNEYQHYIDSINTIYRNKYVQYCMQTQESLFNSHFDRKYHFTLYYYDQAGNLIKTIPPEGVQLLEITSTNDSLNQLINNNREHGLHNVYTHHTLQTRYKYNSLNQLVAKYIPDADPLTKFEQTLPNGLKAELRINKIQMISNTIGYLGGYIGDRGYLYKTMDGGKTWSPVRNLIANDLYQIKMIDASYGIAVGEDGMILKTKDGGHSWDMITTWNQPGRIHSLNDVAILHPTPPNSIPTIMVVGDSGTALKCTNFETANPTFVDANSGISGDILSVVAISGTFYCTGYDSIQHISHFYKWNNPGWSTVNKVKARNFSSLDFYSVNEAYAVTKWGRIFHNANVTNSATPWIHRSSNLNKPINEVRFFNDNQGVAIVDDGLKMYAYRTINGGYKWNSVSDSTFNCLAISGDSTIALAGENGRVALAFIVQDTNFYLPNQSHIANAITPDTMQDVSAIWVRKVGNKYHIILADNKWIWYSDDALSSNPNWQAFQYIGITSSPIKQIAATYNNAGKISGVVITSNGNAYRLTDYATGKVHITSSSFPGSSYIHVSKGGNYFYLTKLYSNLQRVDFSHSNTINPLGGNPPTFKPQLIDANKENSNNILVGGVTGKIGDVSLDITGKNITSFDNQTNKVYPNKIVKLTKIPQTNTLIALGSDGLIYTCITGNNNFLLFGSLINKTINDGVADQNGNIILVGKHGLAKTCNVGLSSLINLKEIKTYSGPPISNDYPNISLNDIAITNSGKDIYIVGDNGNVFFAHTIALNLWNNKMTHKNIGSEDLYSIAKNPSNSSIIFISESNGYILSQMNAIPLGNSHLFIPPIKDIHFNSVNHGTILANDFVVRNTENGGGNWQVVKPVGNQIPSVNYDKVWTTGNDQSLLFGDGQTLIFNSNSGTTSYAPFTTTNVTAVASGTSPNNIYIADNNQKICKINLNNLNYDFITGINIPLNTDVNALNVFSNGSFVLVGENGLYRHISNTGTILASNPPNLSGVDMTDILFTDRLDGVIVGKNGAFFQTSSSAPNSAGFLLNTVWKNLTLSNTDPININQPNINTIALVSASRFIIGGNYSNSNTYNNSFHVPYIRRITSINGRFTQRFYYDRLGRLIVSQNELQMKQQKYSYTIYDPLGKVIEVGQKTENPLSASTHFEDIFGANVNGYFNARTINDTMYHKWISGKGIRTEVTHTYYDSTQIAQADLPPDFDIDYVTQLHRITQISFSDTLDGNPETFNHATHYRYDIQGNVVSIIQENQKMAKSFPSLASQKMKRIDYAYDLVSGNVNRVTVQKGKPDQWSQAYTYDADNRIKGVYTNTHTPWTPINSLPNRMKNELSQNSDWQHDAQYYYYDHGPLARIELGENNLQGIDYYYTLQGWLKGVNSSVLDSLNDPGLDSKPSSINALFAQDVYGFSLDYYNNDYQAISGATPEATVASSSFPANHSAPLYNGNIRYMQTTITNPFTRQKMPMLNAYKYDQLNRLKTSRSFETGLSNNEWFPTSYNKKYFNAFTYDGMGNILTQKRYTRDGTLIDNLNYKYEYNQDGELLSNRLYSIKDNVADNVDSTDLDDMGIFVSTPDGINKFNNYAYNSSGELAKDRQEEIDTIIWTASGKVKKVLRIPSSSKKNLTFDYNSLGQRIAKHIYNNQTKMLEKSIYYIRDAQGNVLSVYKQFVDTGEVHYNLIEHNIYGSKRLGMVQSKVDIFHPKPLPSYGIVGNREYELTNHLGNVLTVINDIVYPISTDSQTVSGYQVGISNTYGYSPFGAPLDGRTLSKNTKGTICQNVTKITIDTVIDDNFNQQTSDWTATGNATLDYSSNEIEIESHAPGSNSPGSQYPIHFGVKKSFTGEEGIYQLSFDLTNKNCTHQEKVCVFSPEQDTIVCHYEMVPDKIKVTITDASNNLIAQKTLTNPGSYNLTFQLSNPGSYNISYSNQSTTMFGCSFSLDNIRLISQKNVDTTVCKMLNLAGGYRYGWQNHERVDEISGSGNHYTAEHWEVDTRTGRRWNIDPVIKPWQSGYSILSNNPIVMVDPDGAADFYNQSGKKVGTDGVDDGKLYVLTTQADVKKARQSYYGKGMKGFFNIILGKGGQGTIQTSDFTGDVVGLPSANVRKEIGKSVDRSNSPTTDDKEGGFHEEGGIWGTDATGTEQVVHSKPGAYANPKTDNQATVNVFDAANSSEKGLITNVQGTFHIHPSGTIVESSTSSSPGTTVSGGTTTTYSFEQTPSNVDVNLATQGGNTSGYNIVVGARNNTVYIHGTSSQNKAGTNYRATFPLDKFKSIGN